MMHVPNKATAKLPLIKKKIKNGYDYFRQNYDTYNEFMRFVFQSNLTNDEVTLLIDTNRPQLEFNILEPKISRLLGEFAKAEPDISVTADDELKADWMTMKVVEMHLRHVLLDIKNEHTRYDIYKDLLAGGFSVLKVYTDYANAMSFDQVVRFARCEPTLCVFDSLARLSHKGDGMYCAELFPKSKEEFQAEYPDIDLKALTFKRDLAGFHWSYMNDNTETILVADYYEKVKKEVTIVNVQDQKSPSGKVMLYDEYKKMIAQWEDFALPPAIIGKPRKTIIERIDRYRLVENQIIEYEQTDFAHLPLVFVDGNSVLVKTPKDGNIRQVCRPYVYNAKGAQRLKNYAGIALANEIENATQAKLKVAKEALPKEEDFLNAYKSPQTANVYVFNSVHENNPELPIQNPISEVAKVPAPPEMNQAFMESDSLVETILGSFDSALGINNNQLSGVAIVEGATQSNGAAMPYIVGFMQGLQRGAEVFVDLLPKYYVTPRTIPVLDNEGKREFVKINTEDGVPFDFDTNALNVVVKAGASFQVQKSRTVMMIKEMMGMSQEFAQFISSKGLLFILDNMEGRGIEQLKSQVKEWQQEQEQMKQRAMAMQEQQMQQNPQALRMQVDLAKLAHEKEKDAANHQIEMEKLAIEQEKLQVEKQVALVEAQVQLRKANVEEEVHHMDKQKHMHETLLNNIKHANELRGIGNAH